MALVKRSIGYKGWLYPFWDKAKALSLGNVAGESAAAITLS